MNQAPPLFDDLVTIGRFVKPQGRKGELLTEPLSDRPERFPNLRRAFVPAPAGAAREVRVVDCWPHKGRFVLKLEGVDSIDAAEGYRGLDLRIAEEELAELPQGSYYHHQLRGLEVEEPDGSRLGRVTDLLQTAADATVLVVTQAEGQGGELLVPLAAPFVRSIDVEGGRLVVEAARLAEPPARPAGSEEASC